MEETANAAPLVHEAFTRHAVVNGTKPAIVYDSHTVSYGELSAWSDEVVSCLVSAGIDRCARVALFFRRTPAYVAAVLGVLRSGAVCVPLDASVPDERIRFLLNEVSAAAVISDESHLERIATVAPHLMAVPMPGQPDSEPHRNTSRNSIAKVGRSFGAFVVFTSGSSGEPKGNLLSHEAFAAYASSLSSALNLPTECRYLHTASFAFSSSNRQLFLPLISGGTIVLADNPKLEDAVALFSFVRGVGVQVIDLIPSRWDSYLRVLKRLPIPELRALLNNELRFALSASEPLKCETVSEWRKVLPSRCRFINMYGATETCGITSVHSVDDAPIARTGFVPIGRPIPGIEFTALNVQNEPVNDGDSGVLHISGPTLADGYVGERASNDRSPQINGVRTINIGDLVRKNASGSWEHLGRVDDQIKIHGTRIEPREIELALCGHPSVRECALSGQIGEGLVMYVAAEGATSAPELRHYLSTRLPVYMVPVRFEFVQRLPRTLSGKIDRRSLMQIAAGSRIASAAITPVQRKLTEICADALSRDDIDIRRSLVEFGADSITLSEIVARVRLEFRVKLAPSAFLSDPTIEKIAALISNSRLQTGRTDTKAAPNTRGSW